jgi:flagellar basal-body rod modification protein FlgD
MSTVSSTSSTSNTSSSTSGSSFSDLTSNDFLEIMLEELQQQDPFDPVSSSDMINQMSQIRSIQSSTDLSSTLSEVSLSQKLSSAGNFIGKTVTGVNDDGDSVNGVVTSVTREDDDFYLELDSGDRVEVGNVLTVKDTTTSTNSSSKSSTAKAVAPSTSSDDGTSIAVDALAKAIADKISNAKTAKKVTSTASTTNS